MTLFEIAVFTFIKSFPDFTNEWESSMQWMFVHPALIYASKVKEVNGSHQMDVLHISLRYTPDCLWLVYNLYPCFGDDQDLVKPKFEITMIPKCFLSKIRIHALTLKFPQWTKIPDHDHGTRYIKPKSSHHHLTFTTMHIDFLDLKNDQCQTLFQIPTLGFINF